MCFAVNFLQSFDTDVSVDLCGVQAGVTKELLQRSKISSVFHHQRGGGVTQQVT